MTATMELESITEYHALGATRLAVDSKAGIVRGVKVLGLESRNGRSYPPATLERAVGLYEGAKVNVNHPDKPKASRAYQDRFGSLFNSRLKPDGIYADLKFNPRHPVAEQFAWDAQHNPTNVGLSHNVEAKATWRAGKQVVEMIRAVNSVDLVADPATTSGLFEAVDAEPMSLAKFIAKRLAVLGMAASELARRSGLSLMRMEKAIDSGRLPEATLVPLAKALGMKPDALRKLVGTTVDLPPVVRRKHTALLDAPAAESVGEDEFNAEQFRRKLFNHSPGRSLSDAAAGYTAVEEQREDFDRVDFRRRLGIEAVTHQTTTTTEAADAGFDRNEFRRSAGIVN